MSSSSGASTRGEPAVKVVISGLANYFRRLVAYVAARIRDYFHEGIDYREAPMSPLCVQRLLAVGRKTLVLDLDETLVHSCRTGPDGSCCNMVPDRAVPDYCFMVPTNNGTSMIPIRGYKRPHVDTFLRCVTKWYDVVIYTASQAVYADKVLDYLDGGRGILTRRFYREHCRADSAMTKDLTLINKDMRATFIIDNSPKAYVNFQYNALPIKDFIYDPSDNELLKLLPFLDALRFTKDVRSVLARRVGM